MQTKKEGGVERASIFQNHMVEKGEDGRKPREFRTF
jgi:hypothetical protein